MQCICSWFQAYHTEHTALICLQQEMLSSYNCLQLRASYTAEEYQELEVIHAVGERLDEVVHEDVLLLKVDVEGYEPGVIDSAEDLLADYQYVSIITCFNAVNQHTVLFTKKRASSVSLCKALIHF